MVAWMCVRCPRTVPLEECSEVYKRYCDVEGVSASYVKDFPVNDTLTVGVTLLEATTDSGWAVLSHKFNFSVDMVKTADTTVNKVWARIAPKGHPEEKAGGVAQKGSTNDEEWGYDMVTISFVVRAIGIFHPKSREEYIALHEYNSDYMTNKNKI